MGNIPEEEFAIIFDQVKKNVPHAKVELVSTKKDILGKTLIECVFFGPLPQEEM